MGILVFLLPLFLLMLQTGLHTKLADFAMPFHQACVANSPSSQFENFYQAIVCGRSLEPSSFTFDLRVSGLLHLIVVSGSHFLVLLSVMKLVFSGRLSVIAQFLALLLLTLVTQFQAPGVRALFHIGLQNLNKKWKLNWLPSQTCLLTGLLSLTFCPDWWSSPSLRLSWAASLALSVNPQDILRTQLRIYLFLFPLLLPFSFSHPISVPINLLLSVPLGFLLFPLSLLAFLVPGLSKIVDLLWQGLEWTVSWVGYLPAMPSWHPSQVSYTWMWGYLLSLNLFLIHQQLRQTRNNNEVARSSSSVLQRSG